MRTSEGEMSVCAEYRRGGGGGVASSHPRKDGPKGVAPSRARANSFRAGKARAERIKEGELPSLPIMAPARFINNAEIKSVAAAR